LIFFHSYTSLPNPHIFITPMQSNTSAYSFYVFFNPFRSTRLHSLTEERRPVISSESNFSVSVECLPFLRAGSRRNLSIVFYTLVTFRSISTKFLNFPCAVPRGSLKLSLLSYRASFRLLSTGRRPGSGHPKKHTQSCSVRAPSYIVLSRTLYTGMVG